MANRKDFLHFPENPVSREMVKNQSPRLTGAALFLGPATDRSAQPLRHRRAGAGCGGTRSAIEIPRSGCRAVAPRGCYTGGLGQNRNGRAERQGGE